MATQSFDGDGNAILIESMKALEKRVQYLENIVKNRTADGVYADEEERGLHSLNFGFSSTGNRENNSILETRIGEYGLALVGSIVLLFGITFLVRYFQNTGSPLIGSMAGYLAAGAIFLLSIFIRRSSAHMANMLTLTSFISIYYISLHLHFFNPAPLIQSKYLAVAILLLIPAFQIFYSIKRGSEFTASIALIMLLYAGLVADTLHLSLMIITITSAVSIYLFITQGWSRLLFFSMLLVYLSHLIWLINNPLVGRSMQIIGPEQYNLFYLFASGLFYSFILALKNKAENSEGIYNTIVILNGLGFSFIVMLAVFAFHQDSFTSIFLFIFLACFAYSIYLRIKSDYKFASAFFVCYGFFALSVSVYGIMKLPDSFLLLALQSLLVVSMALWYRSKIITIMNILLYIGLLLAYFGLSETENYINITFALVALVTARILNWKKERLTLKTELLRNTYLFIAFVMVLISLYHVVPDKYITVSWTASAVFFFVMRDRKSVV